MSLPRSLIELSKLQPSEVHEIISSMNMKLKGPISEMIELARICSRDFTRVEREFVESPYFEESMRNKNLEPTTIYRILTGFQNFTNLLLVPIWNERDPRFINCKTNNFEDDIPLDPISMEKIEIEKLRIVNNTCYDIDSFNEYMKKGYTVDIYRQPISIEDYPLLDRFQNSFIFVRHGPNRLWAGLHDEHDLLTNEIFKQLIFPECYELHIISKRLESIAETNFNPETKKLLFGTDDSDINIELLEELNYIKVYYRRGDPLINRFNKTINLNNVEEIEYYFNGIGQIARLISDD